MSENRIGRPAVATRTDFTAEDIDRHKSKLNPKFQTILRAAAENAEYRSLAERLALPLGTVKSRLHRARLKLGSLKMRDAAIADANRQTNGAR